MLQRAQHLQNGKVVVMLDLRLAPRKTCSYFLTLNLHLGPFTLRFHPICPLLALMSLFIARFFQDLILNNCLKELYLPVPEAREQTVFWTPSESF